MNEAGLPSHHDAKLQEVLDRLKQVEHTLRAVNERTENLVRLYAKASGAGNIEELRTLLKQSQRRALWIAGTALAAVIWAVVTVFVTMNSQGSAIRRLEETVAAGGSSSPAHGVEAATPMMRRFVTNDGVVKEIVPNGMRLAWWDSHTKTEASNLVTVPVPEATKIMDGKKAIALADLRPGMHVRCFWVAKETDKPPFRIEVVNP